MSTFAWMRDELDELARNGLLRRLRGSGSREALQGGPWLEMGGRRVLLLCSNNYLGLAADPRVMHAFQQGTTQYGVGTGAARLVCGDSPVHRELEAELARFKGTESALLFSSGYMANLGLLSALPSRGDKIFCDRLAHASLIDGCLLSAAEMVRYRHNDMAHLRSLLGSLLEKARGEGRRWIVTEGVFSMDGDIAPLPEICALADEFDAAIILDEAHATGVLGEDGRGTVAYYGCDPGRVIQMGTLGKALGVFGAFVAGEQVVVDYLVNKARSFIYTTAFPAAIAAASLEALRIVQSEPERIKRMRDNAAALRQGLAALGFNVPPGVTPVIPLITGDPSSAVILSQLLLDEGVYAQAIRPPTVPKGRSRIRATVMATHSDDDIAFAVEAFHRAGKKAGLL